MSRITDRLTSAEIEQLENKQTLVTHKPEDELAASNWRAMELRKRVERRREQRRREALATKARKILAERKHAQAREEKIQQLNRKEKGEMEIAILDQYHHQEVFMRRTEQHWELQKDLRYDHL